MHRPELFDEYTRRQFLAKAPEMPNPFGTDETPAKFSSFDIFTKVGHCHSQLYRSLVDSAYRFALCNI